MLLFSLIGFTVLYGALMAADIYLLVKFGRSGLAGETKAAAAPTSTPAGAMLK